MMISFDVGDKKFNYRVAGVMVHNNRVLFQKMEGEDFWFLPGGRVEFFEDAASSLVRELQEEFNIQEGDIDKKLLWIVENFFELHGSHFHEIGLYFSVYLRQDLPFLQVEGEFTGQEPGYIHKWIEVTDLQNYNIVPHFLVSELKEYNSNNGRIRHIINRNVD